jgi:hypothetical protein
MELWDPTPGPGAGSREALAELVFWRGELWAVALAGTEREQILDGQPALVALLDGDWGTWNCRIEALDHSVAAALAGLGAEAESPLLADVAELRVLLRELAEDGKQGVLELGKEDRWARVLVSEGRILGAFSDETPELVPSLAPLAGLLRRVFPEVRWLAKSSAAPLVLLAAASTVDDGAAEVERQLVWIVSRFEGAWGRARQQPDYFPPLQDALADMLMELRTLAEIFEAHRNNTEALALALAEQARAQRTLLPLAELDARLADLTPRSACPALMQLVAQALHGIADDCPEASLATFCRQTAEALSTELRSALGASGSNQSVEMPRAGFEDRTSLRVGAES